MPGFDPKSFQCQIEHSSSAGLTKQPGKRSPPAKPKRGRRSLDQTTPTHISRIEPIKSLAKAAETPSLTQRPLTWTCLQCHRENAQPGALRGNTIECDHCHARFPVDHIE